MNTSKNTAVGDELITKFLTGDADPDEALILSDWLKVPDNKRYFENFERTWNQSLGTVKPSFSKEKAWRNLEPVTKRAGTSKSIFARLSNRTLRIAASILIIAAAGFLVILTSEKPSVNKKSISTTAISEVVQLADRSTVTLQRNSSLIYPEKFEGTLREVSLEKGEAFFSIHQDAQKPFIVHTRTAQISVIGTEFDVEIADDKTTVRVKEGKVLLTNATDSVYLTKGLAGTVRSNTNEITVTDNKEVNQWSYATGRLVFEETPLKEVIRDLEMAYPYSIVLTTENIEKCNLTATFDNDSIDKIVNLIAETLNLTVKRDDRIFTIEGEGCP